MCFLFKMMFELVVSYKHKHSVCVYICKVCVISKTNYEVLAKYFALVFYSWLFLQIDGSGIYMVPLPTSFYPYRNFVSFIE